MTKKLTHTNYSFIIYFIAFLHCSIYLNAQELLPFELTYPGPDDSPVIRGDMKIIGNSILGVKDNIDGIDYTNNQDYNGLRFNNRIERAYIDIDNDPTFSTVFNPSLPNSERIYTDPLFLDPNEAINNFGSPLNPPTSETRGTFSSSSAELLIDSELNPSDQICSKIVKAFLYWGGIYPSESQLVDPLRGIDLVTLERPECNGCEHYTDVKILPPGATKYVDIKESNSGDDYNSLKSRVIFDSSTGREYSFSETSLLNESTYACVADVTSLFTHLQDVDQATEGNWTVANVRATTGYKRSGSAAGWSLAVIYEDPLSDIQKNITFFEGFVNIESGQEPVNFNIQGFETIANGPVNVDIATLAFEGDNGIRGDQFQINNPNPDGTISSDWMSLSYEGSDANNFYDSSIYSKGNITRYPNSSNTLGYDSDHFQIVNGPNGNDYITNSDTSADFRLITQGDSFFNFFNAFAIDVDSSELEELSCTGEIEETPVYIPDSILKALLVNNTSINTNGDTEIQVSEAENFTGNLDASFIIDYLDPDFFSNLISDFTGIEAFKNITSLDISDNEYFGSFDFSNNLELTELIIGGNNFSDIDISQNSKLTHLNVSSSRINIDVTHLNELEYLNIRHTNFSTIDLSQNLKLKELTFFGSNVTSIDLTNNIALEELTTGGGLSSELDITNNINLINLSIGNSSYDSIDLSNNIKLERFTCYGSQVTSFDFSNNINLQYFAGGINNVFDTLDFSNNINLESFVYHGTENLTFLNLSNGNNQKITLFRANDNPNLTTVCVDDVEYAIENFTNIDDNNVFSTCVEEVIINSCDNIQIWTSDTTYSDAGTQVVYNGIIYENKWYTRNQNPEEYSEFSWSLWTLVGECENIAKSLTDNDFGITVYPSSFTNSITVTISDTNQAVDSLQLVDLSGNVVIGQKGTSITNLENVANGMYLLQVVNTNGQIITTKKVIKN